MKKKSKNKKSIQELILNFLSGKRAVRSDEVTKHVEAIIQKQGEKRKVKPQYVIARALKKMVDDEVLNSYETAQSSFLSLSSQGRHKLRNIRLSAKNHLVSTTWDGYWRLIILDLPESQKSQRDAVRYILKKAGFVQIKRSLWISPFPLEHMIINMKDDLDLHDGLMVIVSDKLDPDTELLLEKKFTQKEDE